jgi:hypothetical protein
MAYTQYRDLAGNVTKLGPNPNRLIVLDASPLYNTYWRQ